MAKKSTRDLILEVASTLFATEGFRNTTMETIASAAGRGRRTIYIYFPNKVEIYNAVVDREISQIMDPLQEVISSEGLTVDILCKYSNVRFEAISDLLKRNPLLAKDFILISNRIEKLRERLHKEEIKALVPFFTNRSKSGSFSSDFTPTELAKTFSNMLRGNDRLLVEKNSHESSAALMKAACEIFIRGTKSL